MSTYFSVKNFERFQHYKDRRPPWIKLYNDLLDDYEFAHLPDASKMHLVAIWLLASRYDNRIPLDAEWVSTRISATEPVDFAILEQAGFILINQPLRITEQVASKPLALARSREREGETETETETEGETEGERAEEQAAPGGARSLDFENEKGNGAATLLPSDWTVSEALRNHAVEAGFSKSEISAEETNFKDWYGAAEHGKRRDWDAAFRIWIRRGAERRAAKGGKPGAKSQRERWAAITGSE